MRGPRARTGRSWLALACALALIGCTGQSAATLGPSPSGGPPAPGATLGPTATALSSAATGAPTGPPSDGFGLLPGSPYAEFAGSVSCTGTIEPGDPVIILLVPGIDADEPRNIVLQDDADPDAPRTVCVFSEAGWYGARFVDAKHIVVGPFDTPGRYLVVDLPEVRYHWIQLPAGSDPSFPSQLATISPTLDRMIWVSHETANGGFDAVHVTTAAGDRSIAQLRDTNEGRCGDEDDSSLGAFAQSGSLAYVLNRPLPADASLLVVAGEQVVYSVLAPKAGWIAREGPAHAAWSPTSDTLYYRTGDGVWRWSADEGAKLFLPGIRWFGPAFSPDGTLLTYTALDAKGLPDVYLVDLANAADPVRLGTGHHNFAWFLDNEHIWYVATAETAGCEGSESSPPSVYNIADGTESSTTIDGRLAVWPPR